MSIKGSIRKALSVPLVPSLIAAGITIPGSSPVDAAIQWNGMAFDRTVDGLNAFVRFSVHTSPTRVLEIGPNPRQQYSGIAKAGVFTKSDFGQDKNDTIAGIIEAAYPYASVLIFDGLRVIVDKVDHGDFVPSDSAWNYSPVDIHWNCYRRP